jgi:hypothetical protein
MSKKEEGLAVSIGKLALASTVTFFVWKILQYSIGHKIDKKIEERAERKA